jgi:hypothetical protein
MGRYGLNSQLRSNIMGFYKVGFWAHGAMQWSGPMNLGAADDVARALRDDGLSFVEVRFFRA